MKKTLDWNHYLETAAQAAAEGIVMLRNNAALPLPDGEEIAVFGRIQSHYYKSGTGSGGMVNVSKVTGITDGLLEAGVKLNQKLLDTYKAWEETHPFDLGSGWGGEPWSQEEMPLDEALVEEIAQTSRTAIVIIGRTAGEEQDNRPEKGSFFLTDAENEMLRLTRKHFAKVVVLLNTGNIIDMQFMDDHDPDAVLYVWQGGMTGGTGTAMVLTGAVSPSGKLPDTIAYSLSDYPSDPYFGDKERDFYKEDIYVGYRYFETFAPEKVRFPFGFGLSYTEFELRAEQRWNASNVFDVEVFNTGKYPGKAVVQLYYEAPQGKNGSPVRQLAGFAKTRLLAPNEGERLSIVLWFPESYDDHEHCYRTEGVPGINLSEIPDLTIYLDDSGNIIHPSAPPKVSPPPDAPVYRIFIGTDVRNAKYVCDYKSYEYITQCRQAMPPVQPFQRMKPIPDGDGYQVGWEDVPTIAFDEAERRLADLPEEWLPTGKKSVLADVLHKDATMEEFIAQLSNEELASLVRGEGMGSPRVTAGTAAAFGGVTDALVEYGIPAACCSDGPSGMRLDSGAKAFSLPNGTMLAATFNTALITELFYCLGLEMSVNKVDCLLGPGMNIHRHPLNGRNFEYFSEDPFLTGMMAAAELNGLHDAGVTGVLKHCCANNQETNRHFLDSVVSERALREIYLRAFQIPIRTAFADAIMTTYGSVNGLWTAGSCDLCTEILRKEFHFEGIIMTDWWAHINSRSNPEPNKTDLAAMVRAQNDVYMVCSNCASHDDNILQALADGTLTRAELQRNAANICNFLMYTNAMKHLLGEMEEVEVINRPADETGGGEPFAFYDLEGDAVFPLTDISTEKGATCAFALKVRKPGWYNITLTASSEQSELAQMPVTLYCMGTASGTFTWNGTGGKPVSFTTKVPLFSTFTTMRLYFAQSGLKMESIGFELVSEALDPTELFDE